MSSAKRLMSSLVEQALFMRMNRHLNVGKRGPGYLIRSLPEEKREILKGLTSDELQNVRIDKYDL